MPAEEFYQVHTTNLNRLPTVSTFTPRSGPILAGSTNITIEKTFHKTTQWAVASTRYHMRKHFKSRFPAFNIPSQSGEVATDTIFSDTPAIDSGVTMAQIFVGKQTLVADVSPPQIPKTICQHTRG